MNPSTYATHQETHTIQQDTRVQDMDPSTFTIKYESAKYRSRRRI